ncbi:winged helix-turn-helix transcriptional regulator [Burkholderia stagnalis]
MIYLYSPPMPDGPFSAACPTRQILDQIADKWTVLIMIAVWAKPLRFNELKRKVEGISQKVLGQTLRALERNGLIERNVLSAKPLAVTYVLTEHGRELAVIVEQLRVWSVQTLPRTLQAQSCYDARLVDDQEAKRHTYRC